MKNDGFDLTVVVLAHVLCVFSEKIRMLLEGLWACVETQQQDSENQPHFRGKASLSPFCYIYELICLSTYCCQMLLIGLILLL